MGDTLPCAATLRHADGPTRPVGPLTTGDDVSSITGRAIAYAAAPALVDRDTLVGATALGLVPLALAGLVVLVKWWRGRDEVFDAVTPGLVPDDPAHAPRH